jgi:hypothetical protein
VAQDKLVVAQDKSVVTPSKAVVASMSAPTDQVAVAATLPPAEQPFYRRLLGVFDGSAPAGTN